MSQDARGPGADAADVARAYFRPDEELEHCKRVAIRSLPATAGETERHLLSRVIYAERADARAEGRRLERESRPAARPVRTHCGAREPGYTAGCNRPWEPNDDGRCKHCGWPGQ